jgi:very-short-patch-repair endonuclease
LLRNCWALCREKHLVVEVDGGQHADSERDKERTAFLEAEGYRVIRFWNNDVLENVEGVIQKIVEALKTRPTP